MRKGAFIAIACAALALASPTAAQTPQDPSASDYADSWANAHRGDRDWMQRATEALTSGPLDRLFGPSSEGAMNLIINRVVDRVDSIYRERHPPPCLSAAIDQAHNQTLTVGRQEIMRGAADMVLSAGGGAAGGASLEEFLGQQLYHQIRDKLRDQALDQFKSRMREKMREGSPVPYQSNDNRGNCQTELRIVWDKQAERYYVLMAGDCHCTPVSCGLLGGTAPLHHWTMEAWGTVVPDIRQLGNGDKQITFNVGMLQDVNFTVDCCGQGQRRFVTLPASGPGNEWVGFVREPPAQPPARTPTGTETQPPSAPPPPPPPRVRTPSRTPTRAPIDVPVIPDTPLTTEQLQNLGDAATSANERAQGASEDAYRRLHQLQEQHAPQDQIDQAQADYDAAEEVRRRAQSAVNKVMDRFRHQQSSMLPTDPGSLAMLAEHNRARIEAGVMPLVWDPQLAASAMAYAAVLAKGGQLVHAPRTGRTKERENLLRAPRGLSPARMVQIWTSEKRNFVPGIFPNVSRTGNWADVAHYTQMVWRSTRRVGCGIVTGRSDDWLVCRYSPPGNQDGKPVG
jgi:hypothetical protein